MKLLPAITTSLAMDLPRRLNHNVTLSPTDLRVLGELGKQRFSFRRRDLLRRAGTTMSDLLFIEQGWVYAFQDTPDGQRQALGLHIPGDFVGLLGLSMGEALYSVEALTNVRGVAIPKSRIRELFDRSPNIASALFLICTREQALFAERTVDLGRRDAYTRICHFFAETIVRMRQVELDTEDRFPLPISQALIGELLGLSTVHVNRTLHRLHEDGVLSFSHQTVEVLDADTLLHAAGFDCRYLNCPRWPAELPDVATDTA